MGQVHAVFWIMAAAVLAPLLAELPLPLRVPVVVFEVLLGILLGPQLLGLVHFEGFVAGMHAFGMSATLFMAGMELNFKHIRGLPLWLALRGWGASLLIGAACVALLYATPLARSPLMLTLALTTTALGVMLPLLRDSGQLHTDFGRMFVAAGTVGEVGPIVAMLLLLSQEYSTWQEIVFLLLFLALVALMVAAGLGRRPPGIAALMQRTLHASTQLPVRVAMLILAGYFVLTDAFGFENVLGAFAAGMVVRAATRGADGRALRQKIDAVMFGWFVPFFFVGTGVKFQLGAITGDWATASLVPAFLLALLAARGLPVLLYGRHLAPADRLPFALYSSVASLGLTVVISELAVHTRSIGSHVAAALVGAALLSVLIFPTLAAALRPAAARPSVGAVPDDD